MVRVYDYILRPFLGFVLMKVEVTVYQGRYQRTTFMSKLLKLLSLAQRNVNGMQFRVSLVHPWAVSGSALQS